MLKYTICSLKFYHHHPNFLVGNDDLNSVEAVGPGRSDSLHERVYCCACRKQAIRMVLRGLSCIISPAPSVEVMHVRLIKRLIEKIES